MNDTPATPLTSLTGLARARARGNRIGKQKHSGHPSDASDTPTRVSDRYSWHDAFLAELEQTGNVKGSCRKAGIAFKTAYRHFESCPAFARRWREALDRGVDRSREARRGARARAKQERSVCWLKRWHAVFLESLTDRFAIIEACKVAKVSPQLVQKHVAKFPELARRIRKVQLLHLEIRKYRPDHHVDVVTEESHPVSPPAGESIHPQENEGQQ